jgi:hypothetical protein
MPGAGRLGASNEQAWEDARVKARDEGCSAAALRESEIVFC